jgi:hypothetical protein
MKVSSGTERGSLGGVNVAAPAVFKEASSQQQV